MLSKILTEYNKNTGNSCISWPIGTLKTLEYYVNLHGAKVSQWADVCITSQIHSTLAGVTSGIETGSFILVDIPTDLSGRYTLMPLCNSQRRMYVTGTDVIVSVFNIYSA
jgi:hypothetical protein